MPKDAPVIDVPKGPVAAVRDKTDRGDHGEAATETASSETAFSSNPIPPYAGDGKSGGGGGWNRSKESKTPLANSPVAVA